MRHGPLWLAKANQSRRLNPKAQSYATRSSRLGRVIMDFCRFVFSSALVYLQWMAARSPGLAPHGVQGWRAWSFFAGTVADLDCDRFSIISARSRSAHGAHGSTSLLMTLAPPLILLGAPLKLLMQRPAQRLVELIARLTPLDSHAAIRSASVTPGSWLACERPPL